MSGFEEFCGGEIWNNSLTWDTDHPDFTLCFQRTVVPWVPCGFLWALLPFYALALSKYETNPLSINKLHIAKNVMTLLLIVCTAVDVVKGAVDYTGVDSTTPLALVISPLIQCITFIVIIILIQVERQKGFITSGVLFLFATLTIIMGIIPFHSYIYRAVDNPGFVEDVFRLTTFYIYYTLILIFFVLFCFAETNFDNKWRNEKPSCPETRASFLSRITFWWINGLVYRGYKKTLKEGDLWALNPRDDTCRSAELLEKAWIKELKRCNWKISTDNGKSLRILAPQLTSLNSKPNGTATFETSDKPNGRKLSSASDVSSHSDVTINSRGGKQKNPSLLRCMTIVFGPTMLVAHLCKVVCDVLLFVGPVLQNLLISYTEDLTVQTWKGYLYAVLFFITSVVSSFFFHQLFHIGMTLGMRVKAATISLVYQKALTMSNESRKTTTVGEIVNLMSVDSQRLQDASGYLWMVWSSPLQIAIAVALLWQIVGASVLAGLAVMILLIPINMVLAGIQRKLQIDQMKHKDSRIKLMNEILNGIKVLKLYAWELSFQEKVEAIRSIELKTLKHYAYLGGVGTFTWTCAPFLVTLATFTTYTLTGHVLDAGTAFTALSLFNILRFPINMLPMMISYIVTASVSIKRIGKFLQNRDLNERNVEHDQSVAEPVLIKDGTFSWGSTKDDKPVLTNINLNVKEGSLTAVVGQVGNGKSSLLSAMLGEMEKLSGRVNMKGRIAYVAQQAWIQNATLRDNILFGKSYDEGRYNQVLDACALRPDLEILPAGDLTEIGEKGINLSGGQKQRVSMARAVYQDTDLYLLDDPLSAVDSHVGKHIFEKVIGNNGLLKDKTRILVTNGLHFLPHMEHIVVLVEGRISETGTYDELLNHNGDFAQFLKSYLLQHLEEVDEDDEEIAKLKSELLKRVDSLTEEGSLPVELIRSISKQSEKSEEAMADLPRGKPRSRLQSTTPRVSESETARQKSIEAGVDKKVQSTGGEEVKKSKDKLIQDEAAATGRVKFSVFIDYCRALGTINSIVLLLCFLFYQASSVLGSVWLSIWTEDDLLKNASFLNESEYMGRQNIYLGVYGGLGASQALFVLFYAIVGAVMNVRSARILHTKMLVNILRSPMMFFDTTPMGRILNRFSKDIETIDNVLPQLLKSFLSTFFSVITTFIVISYSTPIFLSVVIPVVAIYYFVQRFYIPSSRQLKRIESTTRSPVYVHFSETISGCQTIRAYDKQQTFTQHSEGLVDHNQIFYFATIASNRWLGFRLEVLGGLIILAAAMFAAAGRTTLSGGIVGLSITYALQVTQAMNWMVRMSTDLETNIVSVERVKEYSETPQEADWHEGKVKPSEDWPSSGRMKFKNYATQYRPGLNKVLDDINADFKSGEKIGIVGRTGAGKSSMTLALFRLIEPIEGAIIVDNVDISDLGLYQLRSKLTILPQDPVLFSGTLRMNLDPFGKFSDDQIWTSLEYAHMKEFAKSLPAGLDYEVGEGGQNLSVGQRQLICLARVLLRKTKVLVLDEATAAVDLETDELIQQTIRQQFTDCTVITIAHRLNTILDSDRVMVLDAGKLKEFDSPNTLLANKNSMFHDLARDAGIVSAS